MHYVLTTDRAGNFDFTFGYTQMLTHTVQFFAGDPRQASSIKIGG
jgi:hypothetical protein